MRRGFTLTELLVSFTIIILAVALGLVSFLYFYKSLLTATGVAYLAARERMYREKLTLTLKPYEQGAQSMAPGFWGLEVDTVTAEGNRLDVYSDQVCNNYYSYSTWYYGNRTDLKPFDRSLCWNPTEGFYFGETGSGVGEMKYLNPPLRPDFMNDPSEVFSFDRTLENDPRKLRIALRMSWHDESERGETLSVPIWGRIQPAPEGVTGARTSNGL